MTKQTLLLIGLAFTAFISLGLPDALLGIAWPYMREGLQQPLEAMGLVTLAGTLGAALSGFFSARLGRLFGVGRLLALSCLLTGSALFAYTVAPSFVWIIASAVVIGLAAGVTDSTVNGYVAKHFSERLMQWLHASFGIGITLGPLVMTWVLINQYDWTLAYVIHAIVQWLLVALFFITAGLWLTHVRIKREQGHAEHEADAHLTSMRQSLSTTPIWLSMLMFFLYCGLEASVGLWTFSLLTEQRNIAPAQAGFWVSLYWGMFTLGRILMGFLAHRIAYHGIMRGGIALAILGAVVYSLAEGALLSAMALMLIGLAYAPLYPAMVSGSMQRVGAAHFNNAMGLQVSSAALGIAVIPASMGLVALYFGLSAVPWVIVMISILLAFVYGISLLVKPAASAVDR